VVAVLFILIIVAYWFYLLGPVMAKRAELGRKIQEIDEKIAVKGRIAAQKPRYLQELKKLDEAFREAVMRLPDRREIPGLFHSVSVAGKEVGLEFLLFEPAPPPKESDTSGKKAQKEEKKGAEGKEAKAAEPRFYEEIPIKVKVMGNFVDTMYFFDRIAKLPRIVHITDVQMGEGKYGPGKRRLITTSYTLTTYMFKEEKGHERK